MTALMSKPQSVPEKEGLFKDFSQKTTLHGIRNLGEDHVSWLKKACWLILIVGFTTMTFIQVKQKVQEYQSNPIVTNIDVDFFDQLSFPAIAICNVNLFRISYTSHNIYSILQDVYSGIRPNPTPNNTNLTQDVLGNAYGLNADEFLQQAAHMIDRMVLKCTQPTGKPCGPQNFKLLSTDYGICYAINTNITNPWIATSAGNSYGFQLMLNAETYEITNNPSKTAGFKILVFNQTTNPMVGYSAFDLAPGFMTQIGLMKQQNDKVNVANGGTCLSNVPMDNYPAFMYSSESCRLDGMINRVEDLCGCRPYFAPNMTNEPKPRCTIEQHVKCVVNLTTAPPDAVTTCKENCSTISFKTTLSFSGLLSTNLKAIANATLPEIQDSYAAAMEASSRVDPTQVASLAQLFDNLKDADNMLKMDQIQPIQNSYFNFYPRLEQLVPCFPQLLANYPRTMQKFAPGGPAGGLISQNVDNQFYMNEVPGFAQQWDNMCTTAEQQEMLNSSSVLEFAARVPMVAQALSTIAQSFTPSSFIDNVSEQTEFYYIRLFDLMTQYSNGNITRKEFSDQLLADFADFWSDDFKPNFLGPIEQTLTANTYGRIQNAFMLLDNQTFTSGSTDMIYGVEVATLIPTQAVVNCTSSGPGQGPQGQQQQGSTAEPGQQLNNQTANSNQCVSRTCVTTLAQNAPQAIGQESFPNFVYDLMSCANIMMNVTNEENHLVAQRTDLFNSALQALLADATDYVNSFDFDKTTFYQDNLGGVNIFFNELSVETWSQEQNYDVWSLACDIGGTMGLFLGASLMTLFEFIDLLFSAFCLCKRRRSSPNNTVNDSSPFYYDTQRTTDSVSTPMPMPYPR